MYWQTVRCKQIFHFTVQDFFTSHPKILPVLLLQLLHLDTYWNWDMFLVRIVSKPHWFSDTHSTISVHWHQIFCGVYCFFFSKIKLILLLCGCLMFGGLEIIYSHLDLSAILQLFIVCLHILRCSSISVRSAESCACLVTVCMYCHLLTRTCYSDSAGTAMKLYGDSQ